MPYTNLVYDKRQQTVWLTLNRPHQGNALNLDLANELRDACREINEDEDVRAVVVTGAGASFCSGLDLGDISSMISDPVKQATTASIAATALASLNCAAIAAINGDALGAGLELALCCDIRIASGNASLGFPETAYGLIPGGGGTQRLSRIVGKGKATEMLLTADPIDAGEAYRVGLVSSVVAEGNLMDEAQAVVERIVSRGPIAVAYGKEAVNKGMDMTLAQGLRLEADLSFLLQSTADRAEGIRAFIEKRSGQFKGE